MTETVLHRIEASMTEHGWPLRRISGLPAAHARDTLVTAYFHCPGVARRFGGYVIESIVGVVHQGFENAWLEDPSREPKEPGFGASLYIANLHDLAEKRYISMDALDEKVAAFCVAVVAVLQKLPADQQELIKAFTDGTLCGLPVDAFSGYSHRMKFYAFRDFIRQLADEPSGGSAG